MRIAAGRFNDLPDFGFERLGHQPGRSLAVPIRRSEKGVDLGKGGQCLEQTVCEMRCECGSFAVSDESEGIGGDHPLSY